jgi:hypothetical protein
MAYKAMLEQYGLKVGSVNIVSIVCEEDTEKDPADLTFKSFRYDTIVSIPFGGAYDVDAKLKFKTQQKIDSTITRDLRKLFELVYPGISIKASLNAKTAEELEENGFVKKIDPETKLGKRGVK